MGILGKADFIFFQVLLGNQITTTIRKLKTEFPNSYLLILPSLNVIVLFFIISGSGLILYEQYLFLNKVAQS